MKLSRSIRVSIIILAIIGLTLGLYHRESQIPTYVVVTFTIFTDRDGNATYFGYLRAISVNPTSSISSPFDNVSLTEPYGNGSGRSQAYWRVVIVLNQSTSPPFKMQHDIVPQGKNVSGLYSGVVSLRFAANGNFTLWIIAYGVYKNSMTFLQSFSEIIQIHQSPLAIIWSIDQVSTRRERPLLI